MQLRVKQELDITTVDQDTREGRALASFVGAHFTKGDVVEVTDAQAAALLAQYGDHFSKVRAQAAAPEE